MMFIELQSCRIFSLFLKFQMSFPFEKISDFPFLPEEFRKRRLDPETSTCNNFESIKISSKFRWYFDFSRLIMGYLKLLVTLQISLMALILKHQSNFIMQSSFSILICNMCTQNSYTMTVIKPLELVWSIEVKRKLLTATLYVWVPN